MKLLKVATALAMLASAPAFAGDLGSPCGIQALYAGMIMAERQDHPENREKTEEDFAEAIQMASNGDEAMSVIQMKDIFEKAYQQIQGLNDDEKEKITADFVTEVYQTCMAENQ